MTSENSPVDTDNDSIECFQNYTASEVFIQGLAGLVDQQDVESMIRAQKQILQRFEKTNEMLSNCNTLSVSRLKVAGQQFKNYKQLLTDIKKDLDYTFKKISVLKNKIQSQYPESTDAAATSKITAVKECKREQEDSPPEHHSPSSKKNQDSQPEHDSSSSKSNLDSQPRHDSSSSEKNQSTNNEESESEIRMSSDQTEKKVDVSDSNSSESGEADSHAESNSISNSDTT